MGNDYAKMFRKIGGYVTERFDPWQPSNLLRSKSPGLNFIFGRTHGFPRGYSMLLWGEKKSGKSILSYDYAGQLMQADPEAHVIKFDTEMRDEGQLNEESAKQYGIDLKRFHVIRTNLASGIFDVITKEIAAIIQEGCKVCLIIVDSIADIMGRREAVQESVDGHQMGDWAVTMEVGFKKIKNMIRTNRIGVIYITHAKDEFDRIEQMRGNKKKPKACNAVFHNCEFIVNVERDQTKDSKKDLLGRSLLDETRKDLSDDGETLAHHIKVWMSGNTMGPENRAASFTFDKRLGIVNTHEEVFQIGYNWEVILREANQYKIGDNSFNGKAACLDALAARPDLCSMVIQGVMAREESIGHKVDSPLRPVVEEE